MLFASFGILEVSVLLVAFVFVTVLTETERFGLATVATLATLVAAQWLHWANIFGFAKAKACARSLCHRKSGSAS